MIASFACNEDGGYWCYISFEGQEGLASTDICLGSPGYVPMQNLEEPPVPWHSARRLQSLSLDVPLPPGY